VGLRARGSVFFSSIDENELEILRKKFIIREILETEGKRFDVSGINIYDSHGEIYAGTGSKHKNNFLFARSLDSKFIPGYRMEVFLSRSIADAIFQQTTWNFVLILVILILSGAISTYATVLLARKYATKVKEMERELELKERLVSLGKLASGMAHEIRNPLNAISISVQRLKREFAPGDDKKDEYGKFIDIMRGELGRVDRIVEEFLLSTKSRVPFAYENLHDVMDNVVTILHEKASLKGVEIVNSIEKNVRVECQGERLKQTFYNIILNGIEAITEKGVVEITSATKGFYANITIRDTGIGIKEKDFHSIFEYYFTTKDKGIGLGLPISYLIVKDHRGDIKVFSEHGKGTKFVVSLPLKQPEAEKVRR
jgi:signal transduction histidine kinase